jgi:molybdate-binding protein
MIHDRGLPATKITGKWLFPRHLVDRWLESNVVNMPETQPFLKAAGDLLLIAGSDDPLLIDLIALFRKRSPNILVLQSRAGSSDGLMALKKGLVHIACVHLVDPEGGYGTDHIRQFLGEEIAIITFAERTQGIILGQENPQVIRDLADALERRMRWAVRDVGTGTRALMDMEMDRLEIDPEPLLARSVPVKSHLEAALVIHAERADAGFGIEAAAHLAGCDFIPIRQERFDLIVRKENFFLPQVQDLLALLKGEVLEEMTASLTGYDLGESGKIRV